jgi:hypothetical protein
MLRFARPLCLILLLCSCRVSSRWDVHPNTPDADISAAAESDASHTVDAEPEKPAPAFDAGLVQDGALQPNADAAPDDSGSVGPEALPTNVSFDTARQVEVGSLAVWQTLHSDEQVDYYTFEAVAGGFYALSTSRGTFSPDNVMTLYDGERKPIAENDDGSIWPGDAIDARLVVRLPSAGKYFVRVEDRTTPADFFSGQFGPSLYYQLIIRAVDGSTPGFALENANETQPATANLVDDELTGNAYVTLLGDLSASDRDVFAFTGKADRALIGELLAPGPAGDGSTALLGRVNIVNADQHVLGGIDRAIGQHSIHPPVGEGAYQLTVSADGQPGSNGFYAINMTLLPDNPREQYNDSNDTLAMAEPLMLKGSFNRRGLMLARLAPGDVDYFSFDVLKGEQLLIGCESESGGSGVHAMRAELRDERDKPFASAIEEPNQNLIINAVAATTAGPRYLRLSSETVSQADMTEPWARCVVNAHP